uniref:EGF like domain multiple 6 n=1 Tax=Latimeria chalumnae TaxID=7897 RepID=H3B3R2_LATCH
SSRGRRQLVSLNHPGLCRYGSKLECCYGWKRNSKGHCEAYCEHGCKHGECVGPNKCKCFPGFTGKACNQDLNECGLKPRPCEHRCMNTHGSYKCYCLNGYMLMPDGTCANSRTCAMANCQYGCEEVKGEVRCLCPSTGLQLGPDGKNCVDVDECSTGKAVCTHNRRCVNTFGSYFCKCQIGYDLKYVNGRYDCIDVDECVTNTHKCSLHADCLNTQGSFKCKCKQGYRGSGFHCSVIPENTLKDSIRVLGAGKDTIKKLLGHKNDINTNEEIKNVIPQPVSTPAFPKIHLQPFDYEDGVHIGGKYEEEDPLDVSLEEEEEEVEDLQNQIDQEEQSPRGDVFVPRENEAAAFGPVLVHKEETAPKPENEDLYFAIDCSFDQGVCKWIQDTEDDIDWNVADHENGIGYYMTVPAFVGNKKDVGRLKLLLTDFTPKGEFCLTFNYRLAGDKVGKLRVFLDNSSSPIWEQSKTKEEAWKTARITVSPSVGIPKNIIFESERGKGMNGEIGMDNVLLSSGPCPEDLSEVDI